MGKGEKEDLGGPSSAPKPPNNHGNLHGCVNPVDIHGKRTDLIAELGTERSLIGISLNDMILRFKALKTRQRVAVCISLGAACPILLPVLGKAALMGYVGNFILGKTLNANQKSEVTEKAAKLIIKLLPFMYEDLSEFPQIAAKLGLSRALFWAYRKKFSDPRLKHKNGLPKASPATLSG